MSEHERRRIKVRFSRLGQILFCPLIALAVAQPAFAQVNLYVAPGGVDDTNTCQASGLPCATLGYALSQSTGNGDTIHLAAGTYTESGLVMDHKVVVQGAGAGVTVIQSDTARGVATSRVLWVINGATAVVEDVTFRYGQTRAGAAGVGSAGGAGENGAGLLVNGAAFLNRCRIVDNVTGSGGPGSGGFNGGRGGHGAGVYCDGHLELTDCTVEDNGTGPGGTGGAGAVGGAGGDGSGLHNSGVLVLNRSTVNGNQNGNGGEGDGGGVGGGGAIWSSSILTLSSSTISDNQAGWGGAGSSGAGGTGGSGGGVMTILGATVDIAHTTIAGNQSGAGGAGSPEGTPGSGGGLYAITGTVSMTHSLLASNQVPFSGSGPDIFGGWHSLGFNVVQTTNDWSLTGDALTVYTEVDPFPGPLADNGGHTFTRRLPFASLAVNSGDPSFAGTPVLDQRGIPRVQGGRIDVGAYELATTSLYVALEGADLTNDCRASGTPCATLAHAVQQALPGDHILLSTGLHTAVGVLMDRNLAIIGQSTNGVLLQAAASADLASDRLMSIPVGVTVALYQVTLQHGHATDGAFSGASGAYGGAIQNAGYLTLVDSIIQSNRAGRGGDQPAIETSGGEGGWGGAVDNQGTLVISNCLIGWNAAGAGGDAVTGSTGGTGGGGGAIYNQNGASLIVARTVFRQNQSGAGGSNDTNGGEGGSGGGIANSSAMILDQVEMDGNWAGSGGLVQGVPGGVGGPGGSLYNSGGPALITRSTFGGNAAGPGAVPGLGGGVYNEADLEIENSTFYGNSAPGSGGAIFNGNQLRLTHATVVSNVSADAGGGVWNESGQSLTITHALLADNAATNQGPDVAGELTGEGYVLVENTNGLSFADGSDLSGNQLENQPIFLAFSWHGGVTRTLPLAKGSPGVDQGNPSFSGPPITDQRGESRVDGVYVDLGACETLDPDDDDDGMPDEWETSYGYDVRDPGLTNVLTGPLGDPDEDGVDNLSEFIALTRPDQGWDYFGIQYVRRTSEVLVGYLGATGRLYSLRYAENPLDQAWSNVIGQTDMPGAGLTNSLQDAGSTPHRLYQVNVRLADP